MISSAPNSLAASRVACHLSGRIKAMISFKLDLKGINSSCGVCPSSAFGRCPAHGPFSQDGRDFLRKDDHGVTRGETPCKNRVTAETGTVVRWPTGGGMQRNCQESTRP